MLQFGAMQRAGSRSHWHRALNLPIPVEAHHRRYGLAEALGNESTQCAMQCFQLGDPLAVSVSGEVALEAAFLSAPGVPQCSG